MKIGLTGDTHGSMQAMRRVIAAAPPVEQWLHTGDYGRDALYLKAQTGLPVIVADDPLSGVANGTGRVLDELDFYKEHIVHRH